MASYTKEEFKMMWESEDCTITFEDVADCARAWGISSHPTTKHMDSMRYKVLCAALIDDAEEYRPQS